MSDNTSYSLRDRTTRATRVKTDADALASQKHTTKHKRRTLKAGGCHFVWASDESVTGSESEPEVEPPKKRRRVARSINTKRKSASKTRVVFRQESNDGDSNSEESNKSETEPEVEPPKRRRRVARSVNTKRKSTSKTRVAFRQARIDAESSEPESKPEVEPPRKRRRVARSVNTQPKSTAKTRAAFRQESNDGESSSEEISEEIRLDQGERKDGLLHSFYDRFRQVFHVPGHQGGVDKQKAQQKERQEPSTEGSESSKCGAFEADGGGNVAIHRVGELERDAATVGWTSEAGSASSSEAWNQDDSRVDEHQSPILEGNEPLLSVVISKAGTGNAQDGNANEDGGCTYPLI